MNVFEHAATLLGPEVVAQIRADADAALAADPWTPTELERVAALLNLLLDSPDQADAA